MLAIPWLKRPVTMARSTSFVQRLPWWAFIIPGGVGYFALSSVELFTASSRGAVSMLALPAGGTLLFFALVKFVIDEKVRRAQRQGYRVMENSTAGADGVVDLVSCAD